MFTYAEVGATRFTPLPAGYHHLRYRTRIGDDLASAAEAVLTFRMHRASGARVRASADRAAPGVRVTVRLGPLRAPCEVVWAVEEPDRAGFGYGTLPGHPERGEESFLVERDADGRVWFTVTAFSRPATWYARLGGPVVPVVQKLYARRLGATLRRLR
jgi:uncharacterized protein (UPF0548 family)